MQAFIINILNNFGYLGLYFLLLLSTIFPPLPSEIVLVLGGISTTLENSKVTILGIVISSLLASLSGAFILYYLGRLLNKEKLDNFLKKPWLKKIGVKKKDIDKTFTYFHKWKNKAVFFGRWLPIIKSFISIPAGMIKMNIKTYFFYTFFGFLIWDSFVILMGVSLAENWPLITKILNSFKFIVFLLLLLAFIYIIRKKIKK